LLPAWVLFLSACSDFGFPRLPLRVYRPCITYPDERIMHLYVLINKAHNSTVFHTVLHVSKPASTKMNQCRCKHVSQQKQ
jgi:hypothetical protein